VSGADRATPTRRFKPYPAYKDSCVEWLGEIPAHWEVKRLKLAADLNPPPSAVRGLASDTEVTFVPMEAVGEYGGIDLSRSKPLADVGTGYTYFRNGDVVVAKITPCFENGKGALAEGLTNGIAFGTTELHVFRANAALNPRFLFYLTLGNAFRRLGEADMYGAGGQKRVPESFFGNLKHPLPNLAEQHAIAAFLDRETARIDGLVAKKERLIELLQEQRAALITCAVTKGLDPNVRMKDSGVEWLGEIPAHWEAKRIKWAARMVSGHTPDKKVESYWQGGDIPWVSLADTGQLRAVDYIETTAVMTTSDGIAHSSAHVLPTGTVVFSRDATIGLCAITRAGMAVSQHFIGWICSSRLQPEHLLLVLRSMTRELERLTMGATLRTIGMPDVKSLATPIPPLPEQEEIVRHVLHRRAQLDSLVAKVRDATDRLKELRTALISAAVTGKIDVREEVG
jgi:type I restriction enzyme, S subunit